MTRRRSNYDESCWTKRTGLELALVGIILTTIIFSIALAVLLTVHIPASAICESPACITEASQISQRLDFTIDPCDDFHKFSCEKFLQTSLNNGNPETYFSEEQKTAERQLLELYTEPIKGVEHQLIKAEKNLFQACMNEDAIEMNELRTIKEVLRVVGGWPVVEGLYWDDTKFNWIQATYKLRELGYPFEFFLDLLATEDPRNTSKNIFEISIPMHKNSYPTTDLDRLEFMADVAVLFGASMDDALQEMGKTTEFMKKLYEINDLVPSSNKLERIYSVSDFQKKVGYYVHWLEFLNTIVRPAALMSVDDYVLFPEPEVLKQWFDLISRTSKRDQANYIIWRMVEETTPYLTEKLRNRNLKPTLMPSTMEHEDTRLKFCLRETQKRFSPSPLNLLYIKKFLISDRKEKVAEIANNIKRTFIENVNQISWMEEKDKKKVVERAQQMVIVIGAAQNYLEDRILDIWASDMPEVKAETFLNLISQANNNYRTNQYKQIHGSKHETQLMEWYLGPTSMSTHIEYNFKDNVIRIPVPMLQGTIFNEDRPNYFNYGVLGTVVAQELLKLFGLAKNLDNYDNDLDGWSNETMEAINTKMECVIEGFYFRLGKDRFLELHDTLAMKISYEAYKKWANENGEEPGLIATKYTPEQLFWITSTYTICQTREFHKADEEDHFPFLAFYSNFGQDFKCTAETRMNQQDTCKLF